jgi:hypothetical protein
MVGHPMETIILEPIPQNRGAIPVKDEFRSTSGILLEIPKGCPDLSDDFSGHLPWFHPLGSCYGSNYFDPSICRIRFSRKTTPNPRQVADYLFNTQGRAAAI